jgi:hypothetical protein
MVWMLKAESVVVVAAVVVVVVVADVVEWMRRTMTKKCYNEVL